MQYSYHGHCDDVRLKVHLLNKERFAISETGAGFACAKLSEILPAARVARLRQDDTKK